MAKVQDYGKDTDIDIDSVLYFKAEHKYVDVTYWVAREQHYAVKTIQWALKAILKDHPEFERVHRSTLVRRSDIISVEKVRELPKWNAGVRTKNGMALAVPISRRLVPHIRKIANANSTAA